MLSAIEGQGVPLAARRQLLFGAFHGPHHSYRERRFEDDHSQRKVHLLAKNLQMKTIFIAAYAMSSHHKGLTFVAYVAK